MSELEQLLKEELRAYDAARKRLEVARKHENKTKENIELSKIEEHKKTILSIKNQIKNA